MTTSASTNSLSAVQPSASLSDVTTKVCPASSKNFLNPNSPETQPNNSPGVKSIAFGDGNVIPSGYFSNFGKSLTGYDFGIPSFGSSYNIHNIFIVYTSRFLLSSTAVIIFCSCCLTSGGIG